MRRPRGVRPIVLALLVAGAVASATGCTSTEAPAPPASAHPVARPVTTEEAQLLAVTRFDNFDAGSRPFRLTVREKGADLSLTGWVDYVSHLGYAAVTGRFDAQAMLWTASRVGIRTQEPQTSGFPRLPIPRADDPAWQSRALDPAASRLDAALSALSNLGADRPDNPLLVQQTGALWLRSDTVEGTPVTVFAAPPSAQPPGADDPPITADTSPIRLWVDAGGLMLRAEVRIGDEWTTIDLPDEAGEPLELAEGDG